MGQIPPKFSESPAPKLLVGPEVWGGSKNSMELISLYMQSLLAMCRSMVVWDAEVRRFCLLLVKFEFEPGIEDRFEACSFKYLHFAIY